MSVIRRVDVDVERVAARLSVRHVCTPSDTLTPAMPGSPASLRPLPLRSSKTDARDGGLGGSIASAMTGWTA